MTHPVPPVTGYRSLTDAEVALLNEIKALGQKAGELVAKLRAHGVVPMQGPSFLGIPDVSVVTDASGRPLLDGRWISIGATHLQEGFMALSRGVAKPTTFA